MERYDEYKDSGVEWIGEIPAGWEVARIGQVTSLSRQFDSHDNRYIGLENIESWTGRYVESDSGYDTSQAVAFTSGDVLFGKLRPYLAKVFEASFSGLCSSELLPLTPRRVDGAYLSFCLRSPRFIDVVNESTYGTKMPRANWRYIRKLQIPLPPRNVQAAIASFLRSRTYEIDGVIADCEREVELLQEYRKAVISEAVTKGLDPNVPMKDSGIEWLGKIPTRWEVRRIKDLCILRTGHTPPTNQRSYFDGNVDWFTPGDINNCEVSGSVRKLSVKAISDGYAPRYQPGSVLLVAIGASAGKVGYAKNSSSSNQQITALMSEIVDTKWLFYLLLAMQNHLFNLAMFTTLPILNNEYLGNFKLCVPSSAEQRAIATYLDKKTAEVDALIADYQSMADKLCEYRKSLISEAVTGKFKVPGLA